MESEQVIVQPFHRNSKIMGDNKTEELYICDADEAPKTFRAGRQSPIKPLCVCDIDTSQIPSRLYRKRRTSDDEPYFELEFQLGIHIESGRLKFDMRVNNKVYGEVTAKFE